MRALEELRLLAAQNGLMNNQLNYKGDCLMGELENYIYKLAKALHNKDKKQRDQILAELRQLGMDSSTALTLAMDYAVD